MIGIGSDILTTDSGDVRARHLDYARRAGRLTMIVSAFRREGLRRQELSPELTVVPSNSRSRWTFPADALRLGSGVCRQRPVDLIVTQDPFSTGLVGLILSWRFGTPLLIGNHSQFLDNPYWIAERPLRYRLFNMLARLLIRRADALRVVNPSELEKYVHAGVPRERIRWLPTPVPLDRFLGDVDADRRAGVRARLDARGPVLLWVGNPAQRVKDLPTLMTAFARVRARRPDAVLALVGDFSAAADDVDLAAPGVRAPGRVAHADLPDFYQAADLYVHTSRYEGLAKVMVEAAASGLPIVSTNVPGIEAIVVPDQTGLLAPIGDADALADRILELLVDDDRRTRMGASARVLVRERFSRDRQVAAVVDFWRDVADPAWPEAGRS